VELTPQERFELEQRVRAQTTPQRDVRRAQIVLACAQIDSVEEVARRCGVSTKAVYRWKKRFRQQRLEGLQDRPRPGAAIVYGPVERLQIIALACEPVPQQDGLNGWTLDRLQETAIQRGIVASIGRSTVHRILDQADLKPHRTRQWLHSPDPEFRKKVNQITELYLSCPPGAVVISIDEKTGMQATERKYPDKPPRPGVLARREFEYIRHGTQSLIAGFNVHSGKVTAQCGNTRKARDLLRFMNQVADEYPERQVHVIWDNLNIHTKPERWERFNRKHANRFHFHYTPLHASWVNQIELWFSILAAKCLRHGSFHSTAVLKETVLKFVGHWNERLARPFRWTFKGYPLQTGMDLAAAG
jgi:transposase